ncbi:hypothetical protein RHMOL_Rhmol11G0159200 [Rhododendron molle]|uniref:Uncharacterized protein n=1 Tax=Rhododendron molle TaxID=49168 RepID=A0ACC0LTS1_RHOML|nr:hypothetical protein RHMOL_Rhmol11G0159200 [Rhododendron molle]
MSLIPVSSPLIPSPPTWVCRRIDSRVSLSATPVRLFTVAAKNLPSAIDGCSVLYGGACKFSSWFCGLKFWIPQNLDLGRVSRKREQGNDFRNAQIQDDDHSECAKSNLSHEQRVSEGASAISLPNDSTEGLKDTSSQHGETSLPNVQPSISTGIATALESPSSFSAEGAPKTTPLHGGSSDPNGELNISTRTVASLESPSSLPNIRSSTVAASKGGAPSLGIAVIGATGELARNKIFPALFALYYSGFLPEVDFVDSFVEWYTLCFSTKTNTQEWKALCRQNCGDKMDAFLSRTYYLNGGYDNKEGMSKLHAQMELIEDESKANRIFYLSVPQEALLDVATSLAVNAQTKKGWNRVIIEKPFGFNPMSSHQLTQSLLSSFQEDQLYRWDDTLFVCHEGIFTVRWTCSQIILSEDVAVQMRGRYSAEYGIIGDIVQSHILQTIALLAMEPPISLDGEDIRNEKAKVLRSIRKLEPSNVILGQYKASSEDKVHTYSDTLTPTFFAAALFIDNARWDGVPFLIKAGMGLIKHRVEIRIQFRHVPGNLYRDRIGHNSDLATNELILCDVPDEAILVRVNNKIPGLSLQLDASQLNLLYKDKYNAEIPDSYEHLLLDVIDGDNHLFMRSDELAAAWNILSPVLQEIDKKNIAPELYELGGRGPIGAFYLSAKHGVRWVED